MRFLSTRTHGVIDYAGGIALILAPYLLGFADGTAAQYAAQIIGAHAILEALLTDYELGVVGLFPMRVHLLIDVAAGTLLAVSPWLLGFAGRIAWPHVLFGALVVVVGLTTRAARADGVSSP